MVSSGDPNTLATLEAATRTGTEGQREAAMKKYEEYAYAYSFSADQGSERAKTRLGLLKAARGEQLDPQKDFIPNEGRGEDYRLEANKLIKFYSDSADIMDSTEDILSSDVGSRLKLAAVLLQLGGSFATAIINTISMVTHTIPYQELTMKLEVMVVDLVCQHLQVQWLELYPIFGEEV